MALPADAASRRVAEKSGMELAGEIEHAACPTCCTARLA